MIFDSPSAKYGSTAYFKDFRQLVTEESGEPIFLEVWNARYGTDALLGNFVIYPTLKQTAGLRQVERHDYVVRILWD